MCCIVLHCIVLYCIILYCIHSHNKLSKYWRWKCHNNDDVVIANVVCDDVVGDNDVGDDVVGDDNDEMADVRDRVKS